MSDIAPVRESLARWAREEPACHLVVLFGSETAGRTWSESDLDLALVCDPLPSPRDRLRMIGQLQERCGGRRADVVFLHPDTDPVLRFEVFRAGEPLYEASPGRFVEERVRAMMLFYDARQFRRALEERIEAES